MMYRLFIDYPISASSNEEAVSIAKKIIDQLIIDNNSKLKLSDIGVDQINYRLGHDEDRQNRNYFVMTESGHASTKKTKVFTKPDPDSDV